LHGIDQVIMQNSGLLFVHGGVHQHGGTGSNDQESVAGKPGPVVNGMKALMNENRIT